MVILGIDPGLGATGYGVVAADGERLRLITAGDIRPRKQDPLAERLEFLHRALAELVTRQQPDVIVLEMLYTHHEHVTTAAMMGHARGVACLVSRQRGLPLVEYPPNRVKKAVTGHGIASKDQVARMVARWIGASDPSWSYDATDALALAVAHAHMHLQPHQTALQELLTRRGRPLRTRS